MKRSPLLFVLIGILALGLMAAAVPAQAKGKGGPPAVDNSIVDVAIAVNEQTGDFDTLIAAVVCTELVGTLDARGQYTVFAPTDAAFAELGLNEGNICDALPTAALKNILTYHVAYGQRDAADVTSSDQIRMLNGDFTTIDGATINGENIIITDVFATNGVIHVIDGVLLPPG